ncbi:glycosyltransferase family 4 protein [Aerococcaceae bacterium WGS1372]
MKVLLYSENLKQIGKSGLGKAIQHQQEALSLNQVEYTTDLEDSFDLLHINTYFPKSYYVAHKLRNQGIPIVYHAHSTEEDFKNSFKFSNQIAPLFKQWLIQSYRQGDILIAPTPYAKKLLDSYNIGREIVSISNGIDLRNFKLINHAREKFIQEFNYKQSDFIVMGIGLYLERKGILDFVELAKRMPEVEFIWFGYTDLKLVPDKIKEAIQTKLPNLKFAGYVPNDTIILALQASDLFLFPTMEETEGIPALEACAAKANFIVRDIPVFDDWLIDGVHVYKGKTVDDFQILIDQFKAKKLSALGENAYQVAKERDLKQIGKQLIEVYNKAIQLKKH